jgi:hypothetical protein
MKNKTNGGKGKNMQNEIAKGKDVLVRLKRGQAPNKMFSMLLPAVKESEFLAYIHKITNKSIILHIDDPNGTYFEVHYPAKKAHQLKIVEE